MGVGGWVKFFSKKSQFQFGNFENPGGVSIFEKCPNLNYFAYILQYYLYKKCLKFKKSWIWSEGGGFEFLKKFWNSKMSELSEGGAVKPNWEFVQFSRFFIVTPPLIQLNKSNLTNPTKITYLT